MIEFLKTYQKDIVNDIQSNKRLGIFLECGLGKTPTMLCGLEALRNLNKISNVLLIAPPLVLDQVWDNETTEWTSFEIHDLRKHPPPSKQPKKTIFTITPNIIGSREIPPEVDCLVIDESSAFKSWNSLRFKRLKPLLRGFSRRYLLSGTPTPNNYMDLWSQAYILDEGESLGKNITAYRKKYFTEKMNFARFTEWEIKKGAAEEICRSVSHLCKWYSPDTPKCESQTISIPVDISEQHLRTYKRAKSTGVVSDPRINSIVSETSSSAYHSLRKLCSGIAESKDRDTQVLFYEKLNKLEDIVFSLIKASNQVIIFCHYLSEIYHIRDMLYEANGLQGKSIHIIDGSVPRTKRLRIIHKWNMGQADIIIANASAMSHGLNMQFGGNNIIWFSAPTSLETYIQANHRLIRKGQTKRVNIYHLYLKNTINELVFQALRRKKKVLSYVKSKLSSSDTISNIIITGN